jgi:hypothetical protein
MPYIESTSDSRQRATGVQMAKSTTVQKARAPQGAKRVAQAFFDELETISDDKQTEVGKAAQAMIRETLIARRDKAKAAKLKSRASKAAPTGRQGTKAGSKTQPATSARKAPRRRRTALSQPEPGETQNGAENAGET